MEGLCCIILNYNDASTVISLAGELEKSSCLTDLVIVDNCSRDDSWERLQAFKSGLKDPRVPIHLVKTKENGGYGMGNQAGIDYAMEHLEPDFIIIANPDIHVGDRCILRIKEALKSSEKAAAASAMVMRPDGTKDISFWPLLPWWKELFDTGLITRRLFKRWLQVPLRALPIDPESKCRLAGAVPGSFFMIKMSCFQGQEASRLFDPQVFLYCEEKILGQKLKKRGLSVILAEDESYVHAHSVSIDKSVSSIGAKQKLLHESKLYYMRDYLQAGRVKMAASRVFLTAVLLEVRFLTGVLRMRW